MTTIGRVLELATYPVKSMAGIRSQSAELGFHGFAGDRRFAFRRIGDRGGFPWLSASRLPALVAYQPFGLDHIDGQPVPTHVRTPSGAELELRGDELRNEIAGLSGIDVELMMFKHGIFDDAPISIINTATIAAIGREAGLGELDRRRMRANVVLEIEDAEAFFEDTWIGSTMIFGDEPDAAAVSITTRDPRCAMVNFNPDTGEQDARVMKAIVRMHDNDAGVYGTVVRAGTIKVGQRVHI